MEIIDNAEAYAADFKRLNVAWLQKYFFVEPIDDEMLSNPQSFFINKGGYIFFAKDASGILGTFALLHVDDTTLELSKMAVDEQAQGKNIGNKMLAFAIHFAKRMEKEKLVLYSNTLLQPAIHLYKKYGFVEVPLQQANYERANIKMELVLA